VRLVELSSLLIIIYSHVVAFGSWLVVMMLVLEVGWAELLDLEMVEGVALPVRWAWQALDALEQLGQRLVELGEAAPW